MLRDEGEMVGFCGLKRLSQTGDVDIGYRLLPQYWGRGLATEAAQASLRFGFSTLGLAEIVAMVLPGNDASIRVLKKLGMVRGADITYDGDRVHRWAISASRFEAIEHRVRSCSHSAL